MTCVNTPSQDADVLARVSHALGRSALPTAVPPPPIVDQAVARHVLADGDLAARFTSAAVASNMTVEPVSSDSLAGQIAHALRARGVNRVIVTRSGLPGETDLVAELAALGFSAAWWSDTSLDAAYDANAGVTDVWFAVAETGSLAIRASPDHGRAVSLVPPLHIAIVQRSQIVADLIDAMQKIAAEGAGSATVFITGPSKTSDIEMTLVTGVHGPMEVVVLLVD